MGMIWLRRGFVGLLSLILFTSLLGGVWALDINHNFSRPDKLKTWLHDSRLYEQAIPAALDSSQEDQAKNGGDTSVSLTNPLVQKAAKQAFSPQLLESSVNTIIDANYAWLQGKTDKPQFNVNLSGAKLDFATRVGKYVEARLSKLPVCTPEQKTRLQIPVDVFTVKCRPSSLDPKTEGNRVRDELKGNDSFLGKPTINANNLDQQNGKKTGEPYYTELSRAPELYKWGQKSPYILALLALLTASGIIFIALTRRKGWRGVGVVLAVAGLILIATKFLADIAADKLTDKVLTGTAAVHLKQPRDNLIHTVEQQLVKFDLVFGLVFLALAIIIFVVLYRGRDNRPKAPVSTTPQNSPLLNNEQQEGDNTPVRAVDDLPKLKQPQPKPKRPPRLIQ
jgi:hypothetical protein